MKTTIEIPDKTLRRAESLAADQGITLTELVTEAVEDKLRHSAKTPEAGEPSWMKLYGAFAKSEEMRAETRQIQKLIDAAFERIDERN